MTFSRPEIAAIMSRTDRFTGFRSALGASLLLAAGLFAAPTQAAPTNLLGFDDMRCAAWVKADADQRAAYVTWVRGFLSGHNYARPGQQVAAISTASVEYHVNRHCSEKAQSTVSEAAMRIADQFSGRNAPIVK